MYEQYDKGDLFIVLYNPPYSNDFYPKNDPKLNALYTRMWLVSGVRELFEENPAFSEVVEALPHARSFKVEERIEGGDIVHDEEGVCPITGVFFMDGEVWYHSFYYHSSAFFKVEDDGSTTVLFID